MNKRIQNLLQGPPNSIISEHNSLDRLLDFHRADIEEIKSALADLKLENEPEKNTNGVGMEYDDVFILRHLLSSKSIEKAEEHIRACVTFRRNNIIYDSTTELVDLISSEICDEVNQYMRFDVHGFTNDGDVVVIQRAAINDNEKGMDIVKPEHYRHYLMRNNELWYSLLDTITRKTRRLTKVVLLIDRQYATFSVSKFLTGRSFEFVKVQGSVSKLNEILYPQFILKTIIVNVPSFAVNVWNAIKKFFSTKVVNKLVFITAEIPEKFVKHPEISNLISKLDLPTFWGGDCNCENGCIFGVSNALKGRGIDMDEEEDGYYYRSVIPSRSKAFVNLNHVNAGDIISYECSIEKHGIQLEAELIPASNKLSDAICLQKITTIKSVDVFKGNWKMPENGTLIVTLNNESSLVTTKKICLKLELLIQSGSRNHM
jgi:hypothetical protein